MSYYNFSEEKDTVKEDEHYMRLALQEAQKAFESEEIPIGAIIVCKGRIVGRGHNLTEQLNITGENYLVIRSTVGLTPVYKNGWKFRWPGVPILE